MNVDSQEQRAINNLRSAPPIRGFNTRPRDALDGPLQGPPQAPALQVHQQAQQPAAQGAVEEEEDAEEEQEEQEEEEEEGADGGADGGAEGGADEGAEGGADGGDLFQNPEVVYESERIRMMCVKKQFSRQIRFKLDDLLFDVKIVTKKWRGKMKPPLILNILESLHKGLTRIIQKIQDRYGNDDHR